MTIRDICAILNIDVPKEYEYMASDVLTNVSYSDKFIKDGGAYFIAGNKPDEIDNRIQKAIDENVKIVFINKRFADNPNLSKIPHIFCGNVFQAVIKVTSEIRKSKGVKVVGVTGSLGKTTTKDIVCDVLAQKYTTKKSLGNQNTIFPLLENLQRFNSEFYIQEFGAASPNVMPNTVRACIPDAGIITNISDPHLDVFGSRENILKEKLNLITLMPAGNPAFLNYDDELLKQVELPEHKIVSYAVDNKDADYYADNIEINYDHVNFEIVSKDKRTPVTLHTHGKHNISNAVVAYAVGDWFGLSENEIKAGISLFKASGIRQNLTNVGGYNLFIDCYNIAPISLVGAVEVLEKLNVEEGGRRVAVISDINRLGEFSTKINTEVGQELGKHNLDLVLCFGNHDSEYMSEGIKAGGIETYYTSDREQLNQWMKEKITKKDIVLLKGSVARLLSKSIDQVYGTSLHIISEHFEYVRKDDFKAKVIWEKESKDSKLTALMEYNGKSTAPEIITECKGGPVFSIGPGCFRENKDITEISVPEPVFNIAGNAFRDCVNLTTVELPATLKMIEHSAFRNCNKLKEVVIPEGVLEIGKNAFRGCTSLKKVVIPKSVGLIGDNAFKDCIGVKFVFSGNSYAEERLEASKAKERDLMRTLKILVKRIIKS